MTATAFFSGPPDRLALVVGSTGDRLTYAELSAAVRSGASGLTDRGLRPGDAVALLAGNDHTFVIGYHAVILAGGTVLPLDPPAPLAELRRAVAASGARWLVAPGLSQERLAGLLDVEGLEHVVHDGPAPDASEGSVDIIGWTALVSTVPRPQQHAPDLDLPAVLASSSRTGGRSKLVPLTRSNLLTNLKQIHSRHRLTCHDTVITASPLRRIYAMQMVMNHGLQSGATIVLGGTPFRRNQFLDLARQYQATVAYLVPSLVSELLTDPQDAKECLRGTRLLFSGGGLLPPETADECRKSLGIPVVQGYGMTETGCTHLVPDEQLAPPGSIGVPLPDTDACLVDPDTLRPVPDGATGELWVRGPQIASGYLDAPEATAELFAADGWLRTGDLARVDDAGWYFINGRYKDLIEYKGHKVSPAELEETLSAHPAVSDAAVVGVPDERCGELPKAYVVVREPTPLREILNDVDGQVPPHRRIRLAEAVDSLPRASTGELLRHELAQRAALSRAGGRLADATVLLTGATGGLGHLLAATLAEAGANLVITGRDHDALAELADRLCADGAHVVAAPTDLTDPAGVEAIVEETTDTFAGLDILINNAGVPGPHGPLWDVADDDWWHAMEVNLHGTVRATRAALPAMLERGRGRVINIVSSAGHDRWPGASAYSVSKAAVIKVAENLAREVRDRGVAVFSFHPGLLDVGLTRAHLDHGPVGNPSSDRIWKWLRDQRDAGHFTSYDRVAHSILLLADGTADVLSGRYISVDDDIPALCAQVSADRRQR